MIEIIIIIRGNPAFMHFFRLVYCNTRIAVRSMIVKIFKGFLKLFLTIRKKCKSI